MTQNPLEQIIKSHVSSSRQSRITAAEIVLKNNQIDKLVHLLLSNDNEIEIKSSWVLEFVFEKEPLLITIYLDDLLHKLTKTNDESVIRPLIKICYFSAKHFLNEKFTLQKNQLELLIEVSFNILISNSKVAAKVHAMEIIFLLSNQFDWVKAELIALLNKYFSNESAAFKARAKRILKALKE